MRKNNDEIKEHIDSTPLRLKPEQIFAIRAPHTVEDKVEQPWLDSPWLQYAMTPLIDNIIKHNPEAKSFNWDSILYQPLFWDQKTKRELSDKLRTRQPKYIFISSVSAAQPFAYKIAELAKKMLPDCVIIEWWRHAKETQNYLKPLDQKQSKVNAISEDVIKNFHHGSPILDQMSWKVWKEIDFILSWEWEYSTLALIKLLEFASKHKLDKRDVFEKAIGSNYFDTVLWAASIATIKNNWINSKILFSTVWEWKLSIKDRPNPYEYFVVKSKFNVFKNETGWYKQTAHLMFERACPYNCTYCSESTFTQWKIVLNPKVKPEEIKHLEWLKKIQANSFQENVYNQILNAIVSWAESFFDDSPTFALWNPKSALEVAEVMSHLKKYKIPWKPEYDTVLEKFEWWMQITANEWNVYKKHAKKLLKDEFSKEFMKWKWTEKEFEEYKEELSRTFIFQKLCESWCTYIFLWLESMHPEEMKWIQKENIKKENGEQKWEDRVEKTLQAIKDSWVRAAASFQFWLPLTKELQAIWEQIRTLRGKDQLTPVEQKELENLEANLTVGKRSIWQYTIDKWEELINKKLLMMASQNILTLHPSTKMWKKDKKTNTIDYTKTPKYNEAHKLFDEAQPWKLVSWVTEDDVKWISDKTKVSWDKALQTATKSWNLENANSKFWEKIDRQWNENEWKFKEEYSIWRTSFDDKWLVEEFKNHEWTIHSFNTAAMWRPTESTYKEVETWYNKLSQTEKARYQAASLVWLADRKNVILTRNTSEWLKLLYWLSWMKDWWDVLISDQENYATQKMFETHLDYGNTTKKDIATTRPDDHIAEEYIWTTKERDVSAKHSISKVTFGTSTKEVLSKINWDTKMVILSYVSRVDGRIWNLKELAYEIKLIYPDIIIVADCAQAIGWNIAKIDFQEMMDVGIDAIVWSWWKHLESTSMWLVYVSDKLTKPDRLKQLDWVEEHEQVLMKWMIYEDPYVNVDIELSDNRMYVFEQAIQKTKANWYLEWNDFSKKNEHLKEVKNYFIDKLKSYKGIEILSEWDEYVNWILTWRIANAKNGSLNTRLIQRLYDENVGKDKKFMVWSYIDEIDAIRTSFDLDSSKENIDEMFEVIDYIWLMQSDNIIEFKNSVLKFLSEKKSRIGSIAATVALLIWMNVAYNSIWNNSISYAEKDYLSEVIDENKTKNKILSKRVANFTGADHARSTEPYYELKSRILANLNEDNIIEIIDETWLADIHFNESETEAIRIASKSNHDIIEFLTSRYG